MRPVPFRLGHKILCRTGFKYMSHDVSFTLEILTKQLLGGRHLLSARFKVENKEMCPHHSCIGEADFTQGIISVT